MLFYLYRFINGKGEIIYIGRTNDLKRRILKEHFTINTHLKNECYLEIEKIEYTEVVESEQVAYEAILINENRPKYNKQFKDEGCFRVQLPQFEWIEFPWEYEGQLEWLKKKKEISINVNEAVINYLMNLTEKKIETGIIDVDSGMCILQQSFTLVAGVSGSSKTDYVLNIANYNAKQGKRILFINLKDSVENLSLRILSINSKVSIGKLILGQMTEQDWNACTEDIMANKNTSLSFYNICNNHWKLSKILSAIGESNADLVIVDDLQMIETEDEETEKFKYVRDRMDYILKNIQALSVQCRIPIIGTYCISSRKINSRTDHRPMMADFEYDSLQQYPDNIQLLYKDELYGQDNVESKNIIEIITVKNLLNQYYTTKVVNLDGKYANLKRDEIN